MPAYRAVPASTPEPLPRLQRRRRYSRTPLAQSDVYTDPYLGSVKGSRKRFRHVLQNSLDEVLGSLHPTTPEPLLRLQRRRRFSRTPLAQSDVYTDANLGSVKGSRKRLRHVLLNFLGKVLGRLYLTDSSYREPTSITKLKEGDIFDGSLVIGIQQCRLRWREPKLDKNGQQVHGDLGH
jgi:hypothetical protein